MAAVVPYLADSESVQGDPATFIVKKEPFFLLQQEEEEGSLAEGLLMERKHSQGFFVSRVMQRKPVVSKKQK